MRQIEFRQFGAPDVMEVVERPAPVAGTGELVIRQEAVGVNFIDVLLRRGDLGGALPCKPGLEAAGVVESTGEGVDGFHIGMRVAYAGGASGSYADVRAVAAARVVALPDHVSTRDAAAVFFKALTADYLVYRLRTLKPGDAVLFHGAAGGVGTLAIPLLRSLGVRVLGTVGKQAKRAYATGLGCEAVAVLGDDDVVAMVKDATGGRGVTVAYDPIGKATFESSFESLARFGLLVSYGWASGDPDPVPLGRLRERGSVFITRPTVAHYTQDREDLLAGASRVFAALAAGTYRAQVHAAHALEDASLAHAAMEAGTHTGSIILEPR